MIRKIEWMLGIPSLLPGKVEKQKREKKLVRSIVSTVAQGSVTPQYGYFISQDDIKRMRKKVQNYDFTKR